MTTENTYWNNRGAHQELNARLEELIPAAGSVPNPEKNKHLETFRKASNCYYDLYNNGLCNRADEFSDVFGLIDTSEISDEDLTDDLYRRVEEMMDRIILAAAYEQGLHL